MQHHLGRRKQQLPPPRRLAGIYQFSQHAQPCVPFLLIPPLPPQDNNKNDSINPQVMGTLCMPSKQIRPSVNYTHPVHLSDQISLSKRKKKKEKPEIETG